MRYLVILLCQLLLSGNSWAWNGTGHRLAAAITWELLSTSTRQRVSEALSQHPDYDRWQNKIKRGDDPEFAIFSAASTWPDDIRHDPRFYDAPVSPPTPTIAGYPDMERRKRWHYVDISIANHQRSGNGELDQRLKATIALLAQGRSSATEQAYLLPWLIHLVGDSHQPLHCADSNDEGGNGFEVENPFSPRKPFMNLHEYWDSLPGHSGLKGSRLQSLAHQWLHDNPKPPAGNPDIWIRESHDLATQYAYPRTIGSLLPIVTPDFHERALKIAQERIVAAGWRLAHLLETVYGKQPVSRETQDKSLKQQQIKPPSPSP